MSPAGLNDSNLPRSNSTISIPKLADNGSNWVDYKNKALIAMGSRGLMRHIKGQAQKPAEYKIESGKAVLEDGKTNATEEQIEARQKRIEDFEVKEYLARHIIINSVSTRLAQIIGDLTSAKEMWDAVTKEYEGKTVLYQ